MTTKLINVQLSCHHLSFQPGTKAVSFEIFVTNLSDRFASFQVSLQASGTEGFSPLDWYQFDPDISSKTPPGGTTKFCITICKNPLPGFVGTMDVLIRLFSVELPESEHREIFQLILEPSTEEIALNLQLAVKKFKSFPGETINIPVEIEQQGIIPMNIIVTLIGLNPTWLIEGTSQRLSLPAKKSVKINFVCQLPLQNDVISEIYPFTIKVEQEQGLPIETRGTIEVLPQGQIVFDVDSSYHQIPEQWTWIPRIKVAPAIYTLKFHNQSNLRQIMGVSLVESENFPNRWQTIAQPRPKISYLALNLFLQLWQTDPLTANLFFQEYQHIQVNPGETGELDLKVQSLRPWFWFGKVKTLIFSVSAVVSDKRIDVQNSTQLLKLAVYPKIPLWLGVVAGLLLLRFGYWQSCLDITNRECGHKAAVNFVQFNGRGLSAISGSDDQTLIEWNVEGMRNNSIISILTNPIFSIINTGEPTTIKTGDSQIKSPKAIRVLSYKPVENNVVAAGLENGEIQLWDLLNNRQCPQVIFSKNLANRVFALAFSPDSRFLYSGYGSGKVSLWKYHPLGINLSSETCNHPPVINTPVKEKTFGFAIYSLLLVGDNLNLLGVGGQYNTLCLIKSDLSANKCAFVGQPDGNNQAYLQSITKAEEKPTLLATADNQGKIKIWDLNQNNCVNNLENCKNIAPIDQWQENSQKVYPVKSVALSANGCYLVSGGESGKVLLWILNSKGVRAMAEPITIYQSSETINLLDKFLQAINLIHKPLEAINSVDIIVNHQNIEILSGDEATQVKLTDKPIKELPVQGCKIP